MHDPHDRRRHVAGEDRVQAPPRPAAAEISDPAERFRARIAELMRATGRDHTWAHRRIIEQFPDEAAAAGWS